MLLGLANFALPAFSVMVFGPSLEMIVMSIITARLAVLCVHIVQAYKIMPAGWRATRVNKENIRHLMSFGAWMTVSNVISPLMVTADRFIISYVLGASIVAYYTVPFEALIRVLIIPGALTAALFPRLTSVISVDLQAAKKLYYKCLKVVARAMLPVSFLIIIGSYWGLTLWLGKDFAHNSWLITSILAVGLLFNGMAQIPHAAIQASGNMRATAIIHLSELLLYSPLLIVFLKYFGLLGAAVIWVIRVGSDLIILLLFADKAWHNYDK
jgi:O-antigen/teichoic acid export membrane protein